MGIINEKYLGEALLKALPNAKLNFTIADKAVKPNNLADSVVTEVIKPVVDRMARELQGQIDSLQVSGLALSQELGDDPYIGISQKAITEALQALQSKFVEARGYVDNDGGEPSVDVLLGENALEFHFHNIQGIQGIQGDTVILDPTSVSHYTLYNTKGDNVNGAMTQRAVTAEITELDETSVRSMDSSNSSFVLSSARIEVVDIETFDGMGRLEDGVLYLVTQNS